MPSLRSPLAVAVVLLAGCGKRADNAASDKPPETRPAESKPAETKRAATEPVYTPVCARMLPRALVDKSFAGMTMSPVIESGEHAGCALQRAGANAVMITYDCSTDVRASGPGGFMTERNNAPGAKEVPGVGMTAYLDGNTYRVLGNDAPCRLNVSWVDKAPDNAVELVKAVVAGCTMAALK